MHQLNYLNIVKYQISGITTPSVSVSIDACTTHTKYQHHIQSQALTQTLGVSRALGAVPE